MTLTTAPAARALAAAERSFPLLSPANVFDRHPRVRMPQGLIAAGTDGAIVGSAAIDAITSAAKTGQIGDGKIFILDLDHAVRIRTGETDSAAL